jgi:hypothetical protein
MHRRRARPEQIANKAVVAHLRMRGVPGVVLLHPANGMGRTSVEGAILKSMGVMPGAPDLLIFHAGRSYALELKSDAGRSLSQTRPAPSLDTFLIECRWRGSTRHNLTCSTAPPTAAPAALAHHLRRLQWSC